MFPERPMVSKGSNESRFYLTLINSMPISLFEYYENYNVHIVF
jgi:hypothetical protein